MTKRTLLFYISGHGYGHARRCAAVIDQLRRLGPDIEVHVRTRGVPGIFAGVLPPERISPTDLDAGAAERSTLEIDAAGTLAKISAVFDRRDQIIAEELLVIRALKPSLIVSDI